MSGITSAAAGRALAVALTHVVGSLITSFDQTLLLAR
jgi:hypothetical protein